MDYWPKKEAYNWSSLSFSTTWMLLYLKKANNHKPLHIVLSHSTKYLFFSDHIILYLTFKARHNMANHMPFSAFNQFWTYFQAQNQQFLPRYFYRSIYFKAWDLYDLLPYHADIVVQAQFRHTFMQQVLLLIFII